MTGVFISRGMKVVIPPGGFTFGFGGAPESESGVTLHVHFDVCPTWAELAIRHLAEANERRKARQKAWAGTDVGAKATTLEREFESSMQAIMASAIAIDAFYSVVQTLVKIPPETTAKWRSKRTARYAQVAEVLRHAFPMKPKSLSALRANLKAIYGLRDLAVHPSGKLEAPLLHPELDVGVEWRFAYFHAAAAEGIVHSATWILWTFAHNRQHDDPKISQYMSTMGLRLKELFPAGHPLLTKSADPS